MLIVREENFFVIGSRFVFPDFAQRGGQSFFESAPDYYDFIGSIFVVAYVRLVAIQLQIFGPDFVSRKL